MTHPWGNSIWLPLTQEDSKWHDAYSLLQISHWSLGCLSGHTLGRISNDFGPARAAEDVIKFMVSSPEIPFELYYSLFWTILGCPGDSYGTYLCCVHGLHHCIGMYPHRFTVRFPLSHSILIISIWPCPFLTDANRSIRCLHFLYESQKMYPP